MLSRKNSIEKRRPFGDTAPFEGLQGDAVMQLAMAGGDITLVLDDKGQILDASANAEDFPGFEEWIGNEWFDTLRKPDIMPPGWAFGTAWTTLYILLGLAIALVLTRRGAPGWRLAVALFVIQMLLNFSWSPAFFGAQQPEPALFILILMLVLSIAATFLFSRIARAAALLMLPYLAWLAFASILNYRIIELNPGV